MVEDAAEQCLEKTGKDFKFWGYLGGTLRGKESDRKKADAILKACQASPTPRPPKYAEVMAARPVSGPRCENPLALASEKFLAHRRARGLAAPMGVAV